MANDSADNSTQEPTGKNLTPDDWQRIFPRIQENSSALSVFVSNRDFRSKLLQCDMAGKKLSTLVTDELSPDPGEEIDKLIENNTVLLVRAQYFEGGLNHLISFNAKIIKRDEFDKYPALKMLIIPPVKRVSKLFVTIPSKDNPIFLEIPVEGAAPSLNVLEVSLEQMRAIAPSARKLIPQTQEFDGIKVQMMNIGEVTVGGTITATGDDEIQINFNPLSNKANNMFQGYLQESYSKTHHPEQKSKGTARTNDIDSKSKRKHSTAKVPTVLITLENDIIRSRLLKIFSAFNWKCRIFETGSNIASQNYNGVDLLIMDVKQGSSHAVDVIKKLISDEVIVPMHFMLVGSSLNEARQQEWENLGEGIFVLPQAPEAWLQQKLSKWLNIKVTEFSADGKIESRSLILLVDYDKETVDAIGMLLTDLQYSVITAMDGKEAIRCARNLNPNLIILDIDMPDMSGLNILRILRGFHSTKSIPVIILTSHREPELVKKAMKFKIADYMLKPYDEKDLVQRIEVALSE